MNCFGDQITNKNTKTYTKWLKLLSRVLNMPIELKGQHYYSKVFKRINYKLSNSTFWVVIILQSFFFFLTFQPPSNRRLFKLEIPMWLKILGHYNLYLHLCDGPLLLEDNTKVGSFTQFSSYGFMIWCTTHLFRR